MATMEYKGYIGTVTYDDTDEIFHGRVINVPDTITFQGRSVEELRAALEESVEDYLELCAEDGVEPQKPFSGKIPLRLDPELHREVAVAASREGKSLNKFVKDVLAEAVTAH